MLYPDTTSGGSGLLLWMAVLLLVAFAVAYICADRLDISRGPTSPS
jgi:hypothetical protein